MAMGLLSGKRGNWQGRKDNSWLAQTGWNRSEEHTSELQSPCNLVCRLLLEKKKKHQVVRQALYRHTPCPARRVGAGTALAAASASHNGARVTLALLRRALSLPAARDQHIAT